MNHTTFFATCLLLAFAALATPSSAHPTKYSIDASECLSTPRPEVFSYHIHFLYWQNNPNSTATAKAVQLEFMDKFNLTGTKPCPSLFHNPEMCWFTADNGPAGPFVTAQLAFYILPDQYEATVRFATQNRRGLDVLVHPNTGCEVFDHVEWSLWSGRSWEIDVSAFSHNCPGC